MNNEIDNSPQEKTLLQKLWETFSPAPSNSDDVIEILRDAEDQSIIDPGALQIMEGALKVSDLQAREIMVPKSQMMVIEEDFTLEQILQVVIQSQHSRFPVIGESSDDIKGILLAKELLPLVLSGKESFDLQRMLRPATIIPESKRLNVLLQEFREQRYHMAIIVDEYGGVSGLLTIEDVLEEIVGLVEVIKEAYPDKTDQTGRFVAVTVKFLKELDKYISLEKIKKNKQLSHLSLIKQSRLSVMPIDSKSWKILNKMGKI